MGHPLVTGILDGKVMRYQALPRDESAHDVPFFSPLYTIADGGLFSERIGFKAEGLLRLCVVV